MKVTYIDVECANLDCANRLGKGEFVLLRISTLTLLMCGPCSIAFAEASNV